MKSPSIDKASTTLKPKGQMSIIHDETKTEIIRRALEKDEQKKDKDAIVRSLKECTSLSEEEILQIIDEVHREKDSSHSASIFRMFKGLFHSSKIKILMIALTLVAVIPLMALLFRVSKSLTIGFLLILPGLWLWNRDRDSHDTKP